MGRAKKASELFTPPKLETISRPVEEEGEEKEAPKTNCPYCKSNEFTETKDHPQGELRLCECGKWSLDQDK